MAYGEYFDFRNGFPVVDVHRKLLRKEEMKKREMSLVCTVFCVFLKSTFFY